MKKLFSTLLRKAKACYWVLKSDYYLAYTSQTKARGFFRVWTSERIMAHDVTTMRNWCQEIEQDNEEADSALDDLLNLNPDIAPAE